MLPTQAAFYIFFMCEQLQFYILTFMWAVAQKQLQKLNCMSQDLSEAILTYKGCAVVILTVHVSDT